jgi:hypothetical protein
MNMTRKEFLTNLLGAAGATALLAGCGDDGGGSSDSSITRNCAMNGTTVTIDTNHGHVLMVTASDVAAGVQKSYDITGTAAHSHMVTVTAANFATLQSNANGSVQVTSTSGGMHTHTVTILCA